MDPAPEKLPIYGAQFEAAPLPGNEWHGKAFWSVVRYYAYAPNPEAFVELALDYLARENWKLLRTENSGLIQPGLLQAKHAEVWASLEAMGEGAIIHWSGSSSN